MEEGEYLRRLSGCLMNHYRGSMEIHIFTDVNELDAAKNTEYAVFLMGDFDPNGPELMFIPREKILYLHDSLEETWEEGPIYTISKYEEVPRMVDILGMLAGNKELVLKQSGGHSSKVELYGVYSLSVSHLQLPFLMVLADILAEKKRVLVVDLQENSGLGAEEEPVSGMEDVMAMAQTQKYTRGRLISAIGHFRQWDYIYPVRNSECLCEGDYELYRSLLQMMEKEMNYDVMIINFGVRFQGFFRLISECRECFLLGEEHRNGWREKAFYEEIEKRESKYCENTFIRMDMPPMTGAELLPQRIAEQWIWNAPGEILRKILRKENYRG
jgi:hypothetical protein